MKAFNHFNRIPLILRPEPFVVSSRNAPLSYKSDSDARRKIEIKNL